ncbi:retron Ec67 family RNA-directed DNA polymerase/endonuclease [Mesorhizobium amorphae]|uniref:retron Ec67 family RNA-directed DNA polymerase/endonuclease n=1 Tax=Mesorhizobium amorphae TaxID=71433 RepID=UPI001786C29D
MTGSTLKTLQAIQNLHGFAAFLGVTPKALGHAIHGIPEVSKYTKFEIAKKSGGKREICAPVPHLKRIQRRLANKLKEIEMSLEGELTTNEHVLSHGFKPNLSIATNARAHRGRRWVFNIDLADFFPSINFGRVYGFFLKNSRYGVSKTVATLIAQIACYENQLPQGSPSSPVISNIVAHILDIRLHELAASLNCTYTRYADDLTFSTNEKGFPGAIAKRSQDEDDVWKIGKKVKSIIKQSGFEINPKKTRMQYRISRQDVTGLVVNEKVNVRAEYSRTARAMCHQLWTKGAAFQKDGKLKLAKTPEQVRGIMNFVYHIKECEEVRQSDGAEFDPSAPLPGYARIYAKLLDYLSFWGTDKPVLLCEGKTDNIYIKCAIENLAASFPTLIESSGGVIEPAVRFFNRSDVKDTKDSLTWKLQKLAGGVTELTSFLGEYRERIKDFKHGGKYPLVIVVDNDQESKGMFSHIKNIIKSAAPVDGSAPFYYIYANLYVVAIPKIGSKDTYIERLFSDKVLKKTLDGKTFDVTGKKNNKTHYFKSDFAKKVIKKNKANIDFKRFKPLLERIAAVKADYATRIKTTP